MPLYRAQVAIALDTLLAKDALVNVLHFDDAGALSDPQGLAEDLATIYREQWVYSDTQIAVTFYEVGPPPNYPVATHIRHEGIVSPSQGPREIALCLSFYSERNLPSRRGRIYLPVCAAVDHSYGRRPNAQQMNQAMACGNYFSALGGADVDWVVYSQKTKQHWDISNTWCDDEWDVQRRRGLKPSTRQVADVTG